MRKSILAVFIISFILWGVGGAGLVTAQQEYNSTPAWQTSSTNNIEEIQVKTRLVDYLFSAEGGSLRSAFILFNPMATPAIELVPDTETSKDSATGLLSRSYVQEPLFPFDLTIDGAPTSDLMYEHRVEERPDHKLEVRFTATMAGVEVSKVFVLSENPNYSLDFRLEIQNTSGGPVELAQGIKMGLGHGVGRTGAQPASALYLYGDELKDRPLNKPGFAGLGFKSAGLLLFLKLIQPGQVFPYENRPENLGVEMGVEIPGLTLASGERQIYPFLLFAGRDKYTLLEHVGLGKISPPDFFSQLIIAIVQLLDWLYGLTGNYGWAIILFTLIVRIVLFPLTRQQFHAMVRTAEIRPKFEKIQQRYPTLRRLKELHPNMSQEELFKRDRENRRALQEKTMEFYREEKFNPMGGCLPMLLQLPILLILWQAVLYSAEAIHFSPGFLWISDLALHDPTYILVALTAIAMVLQSKTTPQMNTQQGGPNPMIFMFISIGMMVILLKDFPAGLWLYYFLTTLIQVAQQVFINWEIGVIAKKKAALAAPAPAMGASSGGPAAEAGPARSENGRESK